MKSLTKCGKYFDPVNACRLSPSVAFFAATSLVTMAMIVAVLMSMGSVVMTMAMTMAVMMSMGSVVVTRVGGSIHD